MSFDGQVLCQRMLIGPWAPTTVGALTAAADAAAAPLKTNLRRVVFVDWEFRDMGAPPCKRVTFRCDGQISSPVASGLIRRRANDGCRYALDRAVLIGRYPP